MVEFDQTKKSKTSQDPSLQVYQVYLFKHLFLFGDKTRKSTILSIFGKKVILHLVGVEIFFSFFD